jgi:hypothetical protein
MSIRYKIVFIVGFVATFSATPSLLAYQYRLYLTPRASVSEEYTTNVFLDPDDEKDDFITIVSAGFTAELLGANKGIALSYDPAYAYYKEYDENNSWRHFAILDGWMDLDQYNRLEFRNEFLQSEDPLTRDEIETIRDPDRVRPEDTTVRRRGRTYYTNAARATFSHQFGASDFVAPGFNYIIRRDDDPDATDSDDYNPFVTLTYWFTPQYGSETRMDFTRGEFDGDDVDDESDFNEIRGTGRLIRRFTRWLDGFVEYTHTDRNFDGDDEDYQIYEPAVGVRYEIPENTFLEGRVGYYYQDPDRGDSVDGLVADVELIKTWRDGSVDLLGSTGYDRADFGTENLGFEKYYLVRAGATFAFTQKISGDVFGYYRRSEFTVTEDNREDDVYRTGTGLSFEILPWMYLRLQYAYNQVDSTESENNYKEHRGLLSISVSRTKPFRLR